MWARFYQLSKFGLPKRGYEETPAVHFLVEFKLCHPIIFETFLKKISDY